MLENVLSCTAAEVRTETSGVSSDVEDSYVKKIRRCQFVFERKGGFVKNKGSCIILLFFE